jgi:hypothetical protein
VHKRIKHSLFRRSKTLEARMDREFCWLTAEVLVLRHTV